MPNGEADAPLAYTGPERRLSCVCHPKHTRILADHDEKLRQHEENLAAVIEDIKARRAELDSRTDGKFTEIWTALRGKLNAKVFLALVLAFAGTFFGTMLYVVKDVQHIRIEIMEGINDVQMEVQKMKTEVEIQGVRIGNMQTNLHNLESKIDNGKEDNK